MGLLTDTVKRQTGSILCDGKDILEMGAAFRKSIGYMPQQQGYYEEFSVGRYLHYMAALKGMSRKQAKAEIRQLLEVVGLSHCLHKRMGALSGGMRQRILLAQSLLNDPKILLLDEPTAGLDPEERIRIRNYISALAADKIILLATHVVSDVESIAEQVLLLNKGRLIAADTPSALIEQVRPYVSEVLCSREELAEYQSKYTVSNVTQLDGQLLLQLVGDDVPPSRTEQIRVSLDDVYLYFVHEDQAKADA
jgi:ABC-type multidrug transport system ATPase subunit